MWLSRPYKSSDGSEGTHSQPSWPGRAPGFTRPFTCLHPHDRGQARSVRSSAPLGGRVPTRLRSRAAWMAASSPALTGLFFEESPAIHAEPQEAASEARRPRLFGRVGHLDHPQVAAD